MADSKTTALTELTTFSGDETFYVVEDDDGTPVSRRVTVENLAAGLAARTEFSGTYAPLVHAGSLLAVTQYNPSETTVPTTGTSLSDVDATNLAVTFTVPPSGKVLVTLRAYAFAASSSITVWGLRVGSSDVAGSQQAVQVESVLGNAAMYEVLFTGLTPGASLTWKWAHRRNGSNNGSLTYGGSNYGPAVMKVVAAP